MSNVNSVAISGNLGRDAELRETANGTSYATFSVAVSEKRKGRGGEYEEYTNWVNCTVWGRFAEVIAPYLTKGVKVALNGRLSYRSWEQDGQRRSVLEVTADSIDICGSETRDRQNNAVSGQSVPDAVQQSFPGAKTREIAPGAYNDEDIPF